MAHFKVSLLALIACFRLGLGGVLIPKIVDYHDPHPQYAYNYGVNDPTTGDVKQQSEHREGNVVKGQYSLVEPDGSIRTVDYTADPVNGFNAVVSKTPGIHPKPIIVKPAPVIVKQAPVLVKPAPVAVKAPLIVKPAVVNPLIVKQIPVASHLPQAYDAPHDYYYYDDYSNFGGAGYAHEPLLDSLAHNPYLYSSL